MIRPTTFITALFTVILTFAVIGCSQSDPTPDQVAQQIADGMSSDRPQVAWQALPASYQKDATRMIHDYGKKLDTPEFNRGAGVVKKVGTVLKDKKELLLNAGMLNMMLGRAGTDKATLEKNWDPLVNTVNTILDSEITDPKKMQTLDPESFLSSTGAKLVKQLNALGSDAPNNPVSSNLENYKNVKASLVSNEGDNAKVRYEAEGKPAREEDWVRVEGKWIPKSWQQDFKPGLEEMLKSLEGIAQLGANEENLKKIETALDKMLAANNQAEMDAVISELIISMLGSGGGGIPIPGLGGGGGGKSSGGGFPFPLP